MSRRFQVVAADPPWRHRDQGSRIAAGRKYDTLSLAEICDFALPPIAPDAHLFLWRVGQMVEEAYTVCRAWGFVPVGEIVWVKLSVKGNYWIGGGHTVRNRHEIAIIAKRGAGAPILRHDVPSVLEAPVSRVSDLDEDTHSVKPEAFYTQRVEPMVGPGVELFARRARRGWAVLGNEAPKRRAR